MTEATLKTPQVIERQRQQDFAEALRSVTEFPAIIERDLPIHPTRWLAAQTDVFKCLWGDRDGQQVTAGAGVAMRFDLGPLESTASLIHRCRVALRCLPNLRVYGGFAFRRDANRPDPPWESFGNGTFWLPRATLADGQLRIVVLHEGDVAAALDFVERLATRDEPRDAVELPAWLTRTDRPHRADWSRCIEKAFGLFQSEVLEKIVLARRVDLSCAAPLDPMDLLEKLANVTPACYHFCFQTSPHVGFVGATPERLFLRRGRQLLSEVIAGTRRRGLTPEEDVQLGRELMASAKDQLEHDIVRKSIRQRLHSCVQRLEVDARAALLKLATKQHLCSRVRGELAEGVSDGDLIDRLHPTPAVGGYPTENALDEIRRVEPFDRGWYAAPVGWIGADGAEFAVAIRSGLIHQRNLALYSGAGIVPGSTAALEWDEIENKICDFLQLFPPKRRTATSDAERTS